MVAPLVALQLKLEALEPASESSTWGNIWFETADYAFPGKHWSDCAEGILDMWLFNLTDLFSSKNKWYEKSLVFMDGPYEAILRNGNPVTLLFQHKGATVKSVNISLPSFARQVMAHRRRILVHNRQFTSKYSSKESQCAWLETLIQQADVQ